MHIQTHAFEICLKSIGSSMHVYCILYTVYINIYIATAGTHVSFDLGFDGLQTPNSKHKGFSNQHWGHWCCRYMHIPSCLQVYFYHVHHLHCK